MKGFQQIEGVDDFETYSPVVSWITVSLVFTVALLLNLQSIQVDYMAAFPQAPLSNDFCVEIPRGYREKNKVYKLKRNLYGLKQAACNFFEHLKDKLIKQGIRQTSWILVCFSTKRLWS